MIFIRNILTILFATSHLVAYSEEKKVQFFGVYLKTHNKMIDKNVLNCTIIYGNMRPSHVVKTN